MVSKCLSTSRKFASLAEVGGRLGEFCQLLYPLLLAHADDFGRLEGDAFTVKHLCHPTSKRAVSEFDTALNALAKVKLLTRYDVDGLTILEISDFETHQTGLHKRTASRFPGSSGKVLEIPGSRARAEENRTELKRTELNSLEKRPAVSVDAPTDDIATRAGNLVRRYQELFIEKRDGAKYRPRPNLDWMEACELCKVWDDDRLEKLARIVLTTDDEWIAGTDRGFKIFAMKATWADDRLMVWAKENGVAV